MRRRRASPRAPPKAQRPPPTARVPSVGPPTGREPSRRRRWRRAPGPRNGRPGPGGQPAATVTAPGPSAPRGSAADEDGRPPTPAARARPARRRIATSPPPSGRRRQETTRTQGSRLPVKGFLDLRDEGFGFIRTSGFTAGPDDVYVASVQVKRFGLRRGDLIEGVSRPAGPSEKFPALLRIDTVSGLDVEAAKSAAAVRGPHPPVPGHQLRMEHPDGPDST